MKTKLLVLSLGLVTVQAFAGAVVEPTPIASPPPDTTTVVAQTIFGELQSAFAAKQFELDVAPLYAPKLAKHWGAEVTMLHPLNDWTYTGVQFNLLNGNYVMGQANVGLKASFKVSSFTVTPYVKAGGGTAIGGAGTKDYSFSAIAGTGAEILFPLLKDKRAEFGAYGGLEWWSQYPGIQIYTLGAIAKINF